MSNMDIRDLSIGDWVCAEQLCGVNNEPRLTPPMKVVGLGESWVNLEIDPEQGDPFEFEPSEIRGVPITAEVLGKNGFEREKYTIDIAEAQEIEYDGYRHILCQDGVQYDIILADSFGGYFDLEIESSCRDDAGERILISSRLSLDYVEFVYQLQHALRLAGVEKEIIL